MPDNKGYSLMEVTAVLLIISILAVIAIPTYVSSTIHGQTVAAQNNLIAIYNAERNYYFSHNGYCNSTGANPVCASTLANINTNLGLNIADANFTYSCITFNSGYNCVAQSKSDAALNLTIVDGQNADHLPIVLPGGAGCLTTAGASCNPSCATDNPAYCPN